MLDQKPNCAKVGDDIRVQFEGKVEEIINPIEYDVPGHVLLKIRTKTNDVLYTRQDLACSVSTTTGDRQ